MFSIVAVSNAGSSFRGWMQSTGQTSTQAASFVPMHGSVMIYATLVSLGRRPCIGGRTSAGKYNSEVDDVQETDGGGRDAHPGRVVCRAVVARLRSGQAL